MVRSQTSAGGAGIRAFPCRLRLFPFPVEFVREPDAHLGPVLLDWVTMGQVLSVPMIVFGLILLLRPAGSAPVAPPRG